MAAAAAVDTSPLTSRVRAGLVHLLRSASDDIIVPAAVLDEVDAYGPEDPVAQAVRALAWIRVVETPPLIQAWDLALGEAVMKRQSMVVLWA